MFKDRKCIIKLSFENVSYATNLKGRNLKLTVDIRQGYEMQGYRCSFVGGEDDETIPLTVDMEFVCDRYVDRDYCLYEVINEDKKLIAQGYVELRPEAFFEGDDQYESIESVYLWSFGTQDYEKFMVVGLTARQIELRFKE